MSSHDVRGSLRRTAEALLQIARARPPRLGPRRLMCVDGPAGSGKTTLAAEVEQVARDQGVSVTTVHTDDVLVGWAGLDHLGPTLLRDVVAPLDRGTDGCFRRYDWVRGALAERVLVPGADVLVLEGVGSGHLGYADVTSALAWVEAPPAVRRARGLARDGEDLMPFWDAFVPDEDRLHALERTRARADLLVDGLTGSSAPTPHAPAGPSSGGT